MNKYRKELNETELEVIERIESKWNGAKFIKLETGYDDGSICFVFNIPEGNKAMCEFYEKAIDIAYDVYEEKGKEDNNIIIGLGKLTELNHSH